MNNGPVGAYDGAAINAFTAEVEFDVEATASELAMEVFGSGKVGDELDEADSVVVLSGGPAVSVAEADAIQNISEYVGTLSEYDITDAAASIISGNDDILNVDGVETVTVSDGPVSASDGAIINAFTAEVEFDVSATAAEIAAEVTGAGKSGDELDEANSVVAVSGEAVSAEDAAAIIGISGYAGISSDIDITDDAASLISATDAVLNATGVDYVRVESDLATGYDANATYGVNAADGAVLTSFSADIDFDVIDTAQAIAAEVTGTDIRDGSSNSASDLDDAETIFITGGSVNVADANVIQNISGYNDGVSHSTIDYEIKDSVTNIKNSSDTVLTKGNINVTATNVANAMDGAALNAFTADIDFDVADTAVNLADQVDGTNGAIGSLDDAANIEVLSGTAVDVADAMSIQGISGYTGAGDLDIEDTAAALISAGDTVLNQTGVDHVKASDSSVLAKCWCTA